MTPSQLPPPSLLRQELLTVNSLGVLAKLTYHPRLSQIILHRITHLLTIGQLFIGETSGLIYTHLVCTFRVHLGYMIITRMSLSWINVNTNGFQ
jgi:hypothetical protein